MAKWYEIMPNAKWLSLKEKNVWRGYSKEQFSTLWMNVMWTKISVYSKWAKRLRPFVEMESLGALLDLENAHSND